MVAETFMHINMLASSGAVHKTQHLSLAEYSEDSLTLLIW